MPETTGVSQRRAHWFDHVRTEAGAVMAELRVAGESAMQRAPLVSIIITSYNYARFLPAAIESALAQCYPQIEVLVVDDGSTDSSREIIAQYQSRNRVVPVLKEHGGEASAMNAGFARSQGAIVIFLD